MKLKKPKRIIGNQYECVACKALYTVKSPRQITCNKDCTATYIKTKYEENRKITLENKAKLNAS